MFRVRSAAIGKQCEPRPKFRVGHVRQLLARSLGLFHCTAVRDAGGSRGLPVPPCWRWSILRQGASRQSSTLCVSSWISNSVSVFRVDRFNSKGVIRCGSRQQRGCHNRLYRFVCGNGQCCFRHAHSKRATVDGPLSASQGRDQTWVARV
jgi:hypothetical protein